MELSGLRDVEIARVQPCLLQWGRLETPRIPAGSWCLQLSFCTEMLAPDPTFHDLSRVKTCDYPTAVSLGFRHG